MNRYLKKKYPGWFSSLAVVIFSLLFSCAKIAGPGGGPADKKPPDVLSVKPDPGSVAIDPGQDIEIVFSKNMNKESTEKAIFVSPLFFNYPTYEWKGKKLKIKLPEKLKPNTTYSVTIGASAVDTHNNKLGKSKSFSFSTGERINTGKIEGRILLGTLSGMDAWAYRLDSLPPDTFMYLIPDYITQTDSVGDFLFEYLGRGRYLIVGVDDKTKNQFWTPPSEKLALPGSLIDLADDSAMVGGLVLVAADQDTSKPIFSKVISPNSNMISVEFSHRITANSLLKADAFKITPMEESLAQVVIFRVYPLSTGTKVINIECKGMVADRKYKLEGYRLETIYSQVSDSLSQIFTAGTADTLAPSIIQVSPEPSEKPSINGFDIKFIFSESVKPELYDSAISIKDVSGNTVALTSKWKYPNQINIKPQMKDAEEYIVAIDGKKVIDMQGNRMGDSVITYKYTTASKDTLGQLSGRFANTPGDKIIIMAFPQKGDTTVTRMNEDGSFNFKELFPSTYYINAYWDINQNSKFDPGLTKPLRYSEPMAIYGDTIVVRPRWETDIGSIDFGKNPK